MKKKGRQMVKIFLQRVKLWIELVSSVEGEEAALKEKGICCVMMEK